MEHDTNFKNIELIRVLEKRIEELEKRILTIELTKQVQIIPYYPPYPYPWYPWNPGVTWTGTIHETNTSQP
jgi:hypothetical protein